MRFISIIPILGIGVSIADIFTAQNIPARKGPWSWGAVTALIMSVRHLNTPWGISSKLLKLAPIPWCKPDGFADWDIMENCKNK